MEKITPQILGMYLGQKCKTDTGSKEYILSGVIGDVAHLEAERGRMTSINVDGVKPILRPLSDMTKDDYIACGKFGFGSAKTNTNPAHSMYAPETFLYLTSNGFDLFGLIDSGLAIDSTKP